MSLLSEKYKESVNRISQVTGAPTGRTIAALDHLGYKPPKVGALDADAGHDLGIAVMPSRVIFSLRR